MTRADLQALALKLPADILYSREAVARHLAAGGVGDTAAATAYCIQAGWWDCREQFNVVEIWRDGQAHHRATITAPRRVVRYEVNIPAANPRAPAKEKPAPKKTREPQQGGLF